MSEPKQKSGPNHNDDDLSPGQWLLYGFITLLAGGGLFLWLHHLEATGGGATVHWVIALLYKIGGKWTVGIVFGLFGAIFVAIGLARLGRKK